MQKQVLEGEEPITCRPADLLQPEVEYQTAELKKVAAEKNIRLADDVIDDVLTFALFPQIGTQFLENRGNPDAFEPAPEIDTEKEESAATPVAGGAGVYSVRVNGKEFTVEVAESGQLASVSAPATNSAVAPTISGQAVNAVLAGNIFKVHVAPGDAVSEGDPLLVVEAMKMETVVSAPRTGRVTDVFVAEGDKVSVGDPLVAIG